ncbi:hypothetical protein GCM10011529_15610 [Polymorphobacter glacialis]|uniref:Penicillin-insensitive transglycosylase n=1 Tax=Sandarakinorhabdus glacialis TaxID=1614636 RepID=A0A917E8N2_9SPHN|nr:PBP1A family penicillin-binding protein [Polymorphobacter glacialis]GGE10136.1 hypothetical protein GCM10011529_15610 [Polymorphobacter glacialis]
MSEEGIAPDALQPTRWQRTRPLLLPAAAIFGGFFIAILIWLIVSAPLGRALAPAAKPSLVITDSDGRAIARRGDYKEAPVAVARLPRYVPLALIAIEDRRFRSHFGVDPLGIARALTANIEAGGIAQGGSTLTQQLAKTSFLSPERSIKRKLQEVIIALWLEARLSKDEILSRYLSSVYFGDGAYGIRAAARVYFDKDPEDLTLGEAAVLAGMMKAPSRLAPSRHLRAANQRGRLVLDAMVETGAITQRQANRARPARYNPGRKSLPTGSYFADWVLPQARSTMSDPGYGDVEVRTSLDRTLQREAERAIRDAVRSGRSAIVGQGALIAMRRDGTVVAMVGGTDYAKTPFNRVTQAMRQPGSSFKLFVYLAALDAGMRPGDIVIDEPLTIGDYSPSNDDGRYRGQISLATAFAASSNVVAVRLAQEFGTAAVTQQTRKLGVTAPISEYPAMALGTSPITLLEMTQAYAAIARGSRPVRATGIARTPRNGVIETARTAANLLTPWPSRAPMMELLHSAVHNGTGNAARLSVPTHGKTGTTQNYRDALFIGFAGDLVVGVWLGNDDNSPMKGVVGGGLPARTWKRFMTAALARDNGTARRRSPQADATVDAIGDVIESVSGRDAREAAQAAADAVNDAADGNFDPEAFGDAIRRAEDAADPAAEPFPEPEPAPEPPGT